MPDIKDLLARSLSDPRSVARDLLGLNLSFPLRLQAMILVVILTTALGTFAQMLFEWTARVNPGDLTAPFAVIALQALLLLYGAFIMSFMGQRFGGKGNFSDALLLLTWIEFVLMIGQIVQLLLMVLFPVTATIMSALLIALMIFLLVQFTLVLHDFQNPVMVTVGVFLTFIASALIAGIVLVSTGLIQVPTAI